MNPFGIEFDLEQGLMHQAKNRLVRRASDMRGYYADAAALERLILEHQDPLHYEVFEIPVPEAPGHLMYCLSVLQPGLVGEEFFMTKGHCHSAANTAEIYLCLRGEGCLVMKTADGKSAVERLIRGRMVYVPPFWAHRSVNTGQGEPLVSFCVYPAEAGHNYGDIAQQGFPQRIYQRHNQCVIE